MANLDKKNFYITTPIFYPNAKLHMGHAYTATLCDIVARYRRLIGEGVYFLTGSDENTEKVVRAAKAEDLLTEEYLDKIVSNFKELFSKLSISYDQFIRTSDKEVHWPGVEELWNRLVAARDIEKRSYKGLYCVGHEAFITEKELVDGKCPEHGEVPQEVSEENYFFKLSKYTSEIKKKIESEELKIIPQTRKNEILALLERGLDDVSFSRPAEKVSVGIPVPGDPSQRIYVWGDALTNYISALGFGTKDDELYKKFWQSNRSHSVHVIGKDILRFHTAIWPGMLISAGLPLPKEIVVHGFITSGGRKMSKTLGNVIDPLNLINDYGSEAVRYFLSRHISPFDDSDMTYDRFKEAYNADLANGLGNLVSRVMKMAETHLSTCPTIPENTIPEDFLSACEMFDVQLAANIVWKHIQDLDEEIQNSEPFKLIKIEKDRALLIIEQIVVKLYTIGRMLNPILPHTSDVIKNAIKINKSPGILFPRKE